MALNANQEKQLSALELMLAHADTIASPIQGAPRRKRPKRGETIRAKDFFDRLADDDLDDDDFEEYDQYVGPGSRALNRQLRERKRQARARVQDQEVPAESLAYQPVQSTDIRASETVANPIQQTTNNLRPADADLEHALETVFASNTEGSDSIVDAVHENTKINAETAKTLREWLAWEKSEEFKRKNKAGTDGESGDSSTSNLPSVIPNNTQLDLPDADFPDNDRRNRRRRDRRGRRYGRTRGGERLPRGGEGSESEHEPRNRPRPRRGARIRGKLGGLLGLAGIGGALAWANHAKEQQGQQDLVADGVQSDVPLAEQPDTSKTDAAVDLATTAGYALSAVKRVPLLGTAVTVASAGYNAKKISDDTSISDSEKSREQTKNVTSTLGSAGGAAAGAVAGGTIGSVVPVVGTAVGALIGSVLGSVLGDSIGDKVGDLVADKAEKSSDKALDEVDKKRQDDLENNPDFDTSNIVSDWFSKMANKVGGWFGGGGGGGGGMSQSSYIARYGSYAGPQVARPAQLDSKQVQSFAQKAEKLGLGGVSSQFESGGRGVSTVSSGAGDYGGVSYGSHQLASNNGSMTQFLNSKEGQPFVQAFGGQAPGSAGFTSAYKQLASTQGDALAKAQDDYITRTHYAPQAAKIKNALGIDVSNRGKAVQEMVYSTAVQYGGNTNAIVRALRGKDINNMTDQQFIDTVQKSKADNVGSDFRSSSPAVQASVARRASDEQRVLTQMNTDLSNKTDVQAAPVPPGIVNPIDMLKQGNNQQVQPVSPMARTTDIAPVEQASQPIDRQPIVTAADIAPQATSVPQPAQAPAQSVASNQSSNRSGSQTTVVSPGGAAAKTHTMDDIPIFLDDPTLQMINVGYM